MATHASLRLFSIRSFVCHLICFLCLFICLAVRSWAHSAGLKHVIPIPCRNRCPSRRFLMLWRQFRGYPGCGWLEAGYLDQPFHAAVVQPCFISLTGMWQASSTIEHGLPHEHKADRQSLHKNSMERLIQTASVQALQKPGQPLVSAKASKPPRITLVQAWNESTCFGLAT